MPPVIASILAFIQLAMKAAPEVEQIYQGGKALIDEMFKTRLITKEQQAAAHKWADDHMAAVLAARQAPPEMLVTPAPAPVPITPAPAAADALKMFGTPDPANAHETAAGPVANPPDPVAPAA